MSTYSEQREHAFTTSWLVQLGVRVREDIKRESERKETSGLDEREANMLSWDGRNNRISKDRRYGGAGGRRSTDWFPEREVSIRNRMQEPRKVQGGIRHTDTGQYTFENGTPWRDKDE